LFKFNQGAFLPPVITIISIEDKENKADFLKQEKIKTLNL